MKKYIPEIEKAAEVAVDVVWIEKVYGDDAEKMVFKINGKEIPGSEVRKLAKQIISLSGCKALEDLEVAKEISERIAKQYGRRREELGGRVRDLVAREMYGKVYDELTDEEKDKLCRVVRIVRER